MTHNSDSGYSDPYNTFTSTTFCQRKKSRLYPEDYIIMLRLRAKAIKKLEHFFYKQELDLNIILVNYVWQDDVCLDKVFIP